MPWHNEMSDDERPRKLAKLGNTDETTHQELGPAMTGALPANDAAEQGAQPAGDTTVLTSELPGDGVVETTETVPAEGTEEGATKMSKNQLKKLRRQEKWAQDRENRKEKRRELAHQKRDRRQLMVEEARKNGGQAAVNELRKQWEGSKAKLRRSTLLPFTIVIDCGYDDLMHQRERISLSSQLTRVYSDNNRAPYRGNLMFSSFDKLLKERFDTTLAAHQNWKGIKIIQEDFVQAAEIAREHMASSHGGQLAGPFAKYADAKPDDGEVIYLSSDSETTLTELKPYCTYIIGGLVDKNRHKAVCYKSAVEKGVKTAKLPIAEYIKMADRAVLTTNHVVDIMLHWLELGDWGEAFMKILPPRKGVQLRAKTSGQDGGNGDRDAAEGGKEVVDEQESDVTVMEDIAAEAGGKEDDEDKP